MSRLMGTKLECRHVSIDGEYWGVSGRKRSALISLADHEIVIDVCFLDLLLPVLRDELPSLGVQV